jgi:hypothetical protein
MAALVGSSLLAGQRPAAADFALPTTLDELVASNASVVAGGLQFDGFSAGDPYGSPAITLRQITVTAFSTGSSSGLTFTPEPGALAALGADGASGFDLRFYVHATPSEPLIVGNTIGVDGDRTGASFAVVESNVSVANSVLDSDVLATNAALLDGLPDDRVASTAFDGRTDLQIDMSVQLSSFDDASSASLTSFTNSFSLAPVPEPSGLILFGVGTAAAALYARRRVSGTRHGRRQCETSRERAHRGRPRTGDAPLM